MFKKVLLVALVAIFLVTVGCTGTKTLTEQDVQSFAPEITENLLIGLNEENYEKFSRDFNDTMLKGISKDKFSDFLSQIKGKIGSYVPNSKKFSAAVLTNQGYTVIYYATFSEDSSVKITITFQTSEDTYKVAGLYFDSPKLRG